MAFEFFNDTRDMYLGFLAQEGAAEREAARGREVLEGLQVPISGELASASSDDLEILDHSPVLTWKTTIPLLSGLTARATQIKSLIWNPKFNPKREQTMKELSDQLRDGYYPR